MLHYKYLIVGGGMTADAAVSGIREADRDGSLGVISAEPNPPYNRPPLSKGNGRVRRRTVSGGGRKRNRSHFIWGKRHSLSTRGQGA